VLKLTGLRERYRITRPIDFLPHSALLEPGDTWWEEVSDRDVWTSEKFPAPLL